MIPRSFEQSCASFDGKGRLLDWDVGFESEFSVISASIKPGALFRDILREAYDKDQIIRVYLPNPNKPEEALRHMDRWPRDLSTGHTFKYWNGNHIINVQEGRTVSRGVIRIANLASTVTTVPTSSHEITEDQTTGTNEIGANEQDRLLRAAALETSNSILLLRLRTEQKLKTLSITDSLTGLANRRHFTEVFESKWRQALKSRTFMGIAIIDVDHFKLYNDYYGHSAGDTCLRQLAAVLSESMRQGMDLVARYGGEEFAVILPGADNAAALAAAERARTAVAALNKPHEPAGGIVTISIGVAARVPTARNNAQRLINLADTALYKAKAQGRNCSTCESGDD